jgi:hypothetical protein
MNWGAASASDQDSETPKRQCLLPAVVLVEVLERGVEVLVPVHSVHVHRRRDELLVVDRPVPVGVGLRLFYFSGGPDQILNIFHGAFGFFLSRLL